jgi:hypothetical protein
VIPSSTIPSGVPFPNPFLADGKSNLFIPVNTSGPAQGQLYVFTSSMDLVFSSSLTTVSPRLGQRAFAWNGLTNNGEIARTGIYFFVIEIPDQTFSGKIAVVRK